MCDKTCTSCVQRGRSLPGLIKQIHDDMISVGWVTSSADFKVQLFDAKPFGDISPADLESFVLVKLLEYECKGQADAAALDKMRRYLWALRDM